MLFEVVGEVVVAEREEGGVALSLVVPGAGQLGLVADAGDPGLRAAGLLDWGRRLIRAGHPDEETRAGHVAFFSLVDEGLGDEGGFVDDYFVDGFAKTGSAAAGGGWGLLGWGAFAAGLRVWLLGIAFGLRRVAFLGWLLHSGHLLHDDCDWMI